MPKTNQKTCSPEVNNKTGIEPNSVERKNFYKLYEMKFLGDDLVERRSCKDQRLTRSNSKLAIAI